VATSIVTGQILDFPYLISLVTTSMDYDDNTNDVFHFWATVCANISVANGVTFFNLSSLLFHERRYGECQYVLDILSLKIEEYEENLVFKICFLSLEVMMRLLHRSLRSNVQKTLFLEKSHRIFDCIEKLNSIDIGIRPLLQILAQMPNDMSCVSKQNPAFIRSLIAFRMHLYQSRCLIELNQLKQSKKEVKNALEIFQRELRQYLDMSTIEVKSSLTQSIGKLYFGCPINSIDNQNQLALYIKVYIFLLYLKNANC
jgi:hypothetical protein